jgi:hypothetical protein
LNFWVFLREGIVEGLEPVFLVRIQAPTQVILVADFNIPDRPRLRMAVFGS